MSKSLIQKLKDKYDLARAKRAIEEEKARPMKDRMDDIFSAPRFIVTDFWCDDCKRDCSGTGYRQVCTIREWAPTAWFIGYCPKGHRMIRRITDKNTDPYYDLSDMVKRHRYEMRDAFLSPDDPRFKLLYPLQWEALRPKTK